MSAATSLASLAATATIPSSSLTPTSTSTSTPSSALNPLASQAHGECELLGPFALIVQAALGALALLSLVYKRWRERPQRPVRVWFFDVSKQVFGSVLVHISNIFMSMLTSGRFTIDAAAVQERGNGDGYAYVPNPCSFYLLNLAIDTTLGIPILIVLIRVFTAIVALTPFGKPLESIQSGYYGHPPNSWWWLKQSFIYFTGLFAMKICVLVIFIMMPWISRVGDWALRWTEGDEKLQVAFVMMIFPLIMNAIQYYIIDSFIKKPVHDVRGDGDGDEFTDDRDSDEAIRIFDGGRFSALDRDDRDSDDDLDDEGARTRTRARARARNDGRGGREAKSNKGSGRKGCLDMDDAYDPDADADSRSTASGGASSSSSRIMPAKHDIADLLPKE